MRALSVRSGARLSGLGAETAPPSGFKWPTKADYASGLVGAVSSMMPEVGVPITRSTVSAPIQTQITALRSSMEAATGMNFGNLVRVADDVALLAQGGAPGQIVGAVGDLLDAGLNIAADTLDALGVAAEVAEVVPIVGQIVSLVFGLIGSILGLKTRQDLVDECRDTLYRNELNPLCQRISSESTDLMRTGFDPVDKEVFLSPADWFRPLAYRYWQGSHQYPANVSSIMLMLCGGAAGDFGISEGRYHHIVSGIRKGQVSIGGHSTAIPKNDKAGMPLSTRRQLWKLIRATMACVQDPHAALPERIGDQGRSPMPIILDILRVSEDRRQIDSEFLRQLSEEALDWTSRKRICEPKTPVTKEVAVYGSCKTPVAPKMVEQYVKVLSEFRVALAGEFLDPVTGRLRATPATGIVGSKITIPSFKGVVKVGGRAGGGTLKYSSGIVHEMQSMLDQIKSAAAGHDPARRRTIVITSALMGALSFALARQVAKRR